MSNIISVVHIQYFDLCIGTLHLFFNYQINIMVYYFILSSSYMK